MPRTSEIRVDAKYSNILSTYSHETAYSIINGNVLNLLIELKRIEKSFKEEFARLEKDGEGECYDSISDKFYDGYVRMESSFKGLLAETTQINIVKSF